MTTIYEMNKTNELIEKYMKYGKGSWENLHKDDGNDIIAIKNEMIKKGDWNKFLEYCYSSSEQGEMMCNDGDDYYYNHEFISYVIDPNNFFELFVNWLTEWEQPTGIMSKREYMDFLEEVAEKYIKTSKKSMLRNKHMNELLGEERILQKIIDAAIVDFINQVGLAHGLDEGYTVDCLYKKKREIKGERS